MNYIYVYYSFYFKQGLGNIEVINHVFDLQPVERIKKRTH